MRDVSLNRRTSEKETSGAVAIQTTMLSVQTLENGEGAEVSAISSGTLPDNDAYALEKAMESPNERKIHINDSSTLSAVELRTRSRLFKRGKSSHEVFEFADALSARAEGFGGRLAEQLGILPSLSDLCYVCAFVS